MSKSVSIRGSITAGSGPCCNGSGVGQSIEQLELLGACGDEGLAYTDVVALTQTVSTLGAIGQAWVELSLGELAEVEFLKVKSSARVRLRVDARPATALAVGGSYPTGFVGGETVTWTLDAMAPIVVTFTSGDQSVEQVAARFNAAAALAGAPTPRVTVVGGQLFFTSAVASPLPAESGNTFAAGAPTTTLGLASPTVTPGKGGDVDIAGLAILQFPRSPNAPVRIDASGTATLEIIAAGRPAS